jgi:hypothetical protein
MDNQKPRNSFLRLIYSRIVPSGEIPPTAEFMIKHKIARNEFQALLAMFVIIIVSVLLSISFFTAGSRQSNSSYVTNVGAERFMFGNAGSNLPR